MRQERCFRAWNISPRELFSVEQVMIFRIAGFVGKKNCQCMVTLVPRFSTMDPLLEKYYDISPYVYCANNPVRFIDPTGMIWEDPQEAERLKKNIDNRITSLNKDIVRNQDKLDKGGLSEKQIGKLERSIGSRSKQCVCFKLN